MSPTHHRPNPEAHLDPCQRWQEALRYRAPFLEKKLLERRLADSAVEAGALFDEIKRYLVLQEVNRDRSFPMFSERLDEVWHNFGLFTGKYSDYCQRFFGRYLDHLPQNAPAIQELPRGPEASFDDLRAAYHGLFGVPLPALWDDAHCLGLHRRVIRGRGCTGLFTRIEGSKAELCMEMAHGLHVFIRVDAWGLPALRFVAAVPTFYVRELPGVADEDKVVLARGLFRGNVLRVAP